MYATFRRLFFPLLVLGLIAARCPGDTDGDGVERPRPVAGPTSPPATVGFPAADCEDGWISPDPGTSLFRAPLRLIRGILGIEGRFTVDEMRYFTGPESPPSIQGYLLLVERWYVKGKLASDPSIRGRFLVEERKFGSGVSAVAPYGTEGFRSPDWVGFQWEEGGTPGIYEGLPGTWQGRPYDFVTGGETFDFPGLPEVVVGCMAGT